jgi:hypothetical protein
VHLLVRRRTCGGDGQGGEDQQGGAGQIDRFRAGDIEQTAQRRAADCRALEAQRVPGDRLAKIGPRHDAGQQRTRRGGREGVHAAQNDRRREHDPQLHRAGEEGARRQGKGAGHADHIRNNEYQAPVEPVGCLPADQRQQENRRELGEADKAQHQRAFLDRAGLARHVIDLPADRDRLHLPRSGDRLPHRPVVAVGLVAEDVERRCQHARER